MLHSKKIGTLCIGLCFSLTAFADDQAAKEDFTPPPAIAALTADQIPPLFTKPASTAAAPTPPPAATSTQAPTSQPASPTAIISVPPSN